jgi:lysophospholipase L1-like esterase
VTRAPVIVAREEATEHASAGRPHPWRLFANAVTGGVLGGVLLVRSELRSARRRYAAVRTSAPPIDQTVLPAGSTGGDAAPVELAALGDSGMAGVGVREATDTLPIQLAHRVADALGRPVHVTGYGRSGARTRDVLDGQVPQLRRPVDACVLMAGTNDVIGMTPWPRLARDTAGLLDALTETGAPVIMSSLPEFRAMTAVPLALRQVVSAWAVGVRRVQRQAVRARRDVVLVDVRAAVGSRFVSDAAAMG